ncbi:FAD binding domain-containing protein [Jannaschia sp. LMIT008]|uniref:FAD binding domain-containing protein n=1 Tax=Jannaschia maritima TaxID=3032585 RepID=UPI00281107FE|nr:FAD binding domain-containing protein [Jannaschia sp. LMIT008]
MDNFTYDRAGSVEDAARAGAGGAAIAAGTTELINWMRLGIAAPEAVVDISGLDLRGIARDGDVLLVGALATLNEVGTSDLVRADAPVLAQAALKAASAQLRNRATLGGNVLQRTRCPYFRVEAANEARVPWPCNKRVAGTGCAALDQPFSRAAILGWTQDCVATQPSDPVVALAALDAVAEVQGPDGAREIAMTEFHLSQEEGGLDEETRLAPGEVILGYRIPVDAASRGSAYLKVRERESYEYAMVSAAVCLDHADGAIRSARVALGSVAQKPWRLSRAEAALEGAALDEATVQAAMDAAMEEARPLPGQEWKPRLAANAAARAVMMAGGAI